VEILEEIIQNAKTIGDLKSILDFRLISFVFWFSDIYRWVNWSNCWLAQWDVDGSFLWTRQQKWDRATADAINSEYKWLYPTCSIEI